MQDSWASVADTIQFYAKDIGNFSSQARPGYFNDPDEVGVLKLQSRNIFVIISFCFVHFDESCIKSIIYCSSDHDYEELRDIKTFDDITTIKLKIS